MKDPTKSADLGNPLWRRNPLAIGNSSESIFDRINKALTASSAQSGNDATSSAYNRRYAIETQRKGPARNPDRKIQSR